MLKTVCLTVALAEACGASAGAASDGEVKQPFEIRLEGTRNGQNFPFLKIHVRHNGKDEGYANVRFPETIAGPDATANQWLKFYQDLRSPVWPAKLECEPVDLPPKWEGDDHKQAYTMRLDPHSLCPIHHRGRRAQAHLAIIKSRDQLVSTRTAFINHARGMVKSVGERLPYTTRFTIR
jgi:hypothetical protein